MPRPPSSGVPSLPAGVPRARARSGVGKLPSATRIKGRAVRRAGELLKQIEEKRGARTDIEPVDGSVNRLTRTEAAREAGMSERQQVTAVRVASVPREDFDA